MLTSQNAAGNLEGFLESDPVLLGDGERVFFFDYMYRGNETYFILCGNSLYINCVAIGGYGCLQPSKIRPFIHAFWAVPKLISRPEIVFADRCPDVEDQILVVSYDGNRESSTVKEVLCVHNAKTFSQADSLRSFIGRNGMIVVWTVASKCKGYVIVRSATARTLIDCSPPSFLFDQCQGV